MFETISFKKSFFPFFGNDKKKNFRNDMQQLLKFPEIQYVHMEIARHCYFSKGNCHCHSKYEYMYMLKTNKKNLKKNQHNCRIKNRWK